MSTPESVQAKPKRDKKNWLPREPLFVRFVQVGRVVRILRGHDVNRLAVITEIIDQNRVMIDGPTTHVKRKPIRLAYVDLTPFRVKTTRSVKTKKLLEDIKKNDFVNGWRKTLLAQRIEARRRKAVLNDFGHFKARIVRRKRRSVIIQSFRKVRAEKRRENLKVRLARTLDRKSKKPAAKPAGKDAKPAKKPAAKPKGKPVKKPAAKPAVKGTKPAKKQGAKPAKAEGKKKPVEKGKKGAK